MQVVRGAAPAAAPQWSGEPFQQTRLLPWEPSNLGTMTVSPGMPLEDPGCHSPQAYVSARSLGSVHSEVVPSSSTAHFRAKTLFLG